MELIDYVRLLLRSWILIVVCSLLGLGLAAAYLLTQPVLYVASSSTYVSASSAADVAAASAGSSFAKDEAVDLAEIAHSPYVLNNVRRALKVATSTEALSDQVQTQVLANTSIIQVTATTRTPALSSALANAVAVELSYAVERLNPNVGNASTIRRATTPTSPASPTVTFDLAIGLIAGFAIGVLVILLRQSIDQRIRSADQLARVSRAPVIGTVPPTPPAWEGRPVLLEEGRIGAFRAVRSEILEGASQKRVIVVSGTRRGESTASLATSIAASIANARLTTLVIDAVSGSAPAAPIFGSSTEPGLTEALDRSKPLQQLLVEGPINGLWYLPPGRPSGQRDDLIASFEMTDLLETIVSQFHVVIINTDAVEDSSISRTLGRQADGVVLVCRLNGSSAPDVRRSAESLERGGARLLGSVLVLPELRAPRRHAARASLTPADAGA